MTHPDRIKERIKLARNEKRRAVIYGLRLVAGNVIDLTFHETRDSSTRSRKSEYEDVERTTWEEGRHNSISSNTQVQAKSLLIVPPKVKWVEIPYERPEIIDQTRQAFFLKAWKDQHLSTAYLRALLDLLICGERVMQVGPRNGAPFLDYADVLDCGFDPAYKEEHRKRYCFIDKHLPLGDALREYPALAEVMNLRTKDEGKGLEEIVCLTCYWDRDDMTSAVLKGDKFVRKPEPNAYEGINNGFPLLRKTLIEEPSIASPSGTVESQLGTHKLMLRLMRSFSTSALRGVPIGVARNSSGVIDNAIKDQIENAEEGTVIEFQNAHDGFEWVEGAKVQDWAVKMYEMLRQMQNEESNVNDFQKNRSDVRVDFASQLALMAKQGGAAQRFTEEAYQDGMRDDIRAFMTAGARWQTNPVALRVLGQGFRFEEPLETGEMLSIGPLLDGDGDVQFQDRALYQSPAQKLQEVAVLGQVLTMAATLPMGLQERFVGMALTAFEVEDKDAWLEALAMAQQEAVFANAAASAALPGESPPQTSAPLTPRNSAPIGA